MEFVRNACEFLRIDEASGRLVSALQGSSECPCTPLFHPLGYIYVMNLWSHVRAYSYHRMIGCNGCVCEWFAMSYRVQRCSSCCLTRDLARNITASLRTGASKAGSTPSRWTHHRWQRCVSVRESSLCSQTFKRGIYSSVDVTAAVLMGLLLC